MKVQVRDIISKINIYDAKVIYDTPDVVSEKITSGNTNALFCLSVCSDKEKSKFEKTKSSAFKTTTAAIHLPDLTSWDIVDIFQCAAGNQYQKLRDAINSFCGNGVNDDIVLVIYLFLHEVGHFKQLEQCLFVVNDYIETDKEKYKVHYDHYFAFNEKRNERLSKGNKCLFTFNEKKRLSELDEEYRAIPKEADADNFAFEHMAEALKRYIS